MASWLRRGNDEAWQSTQNDSPEGQCISHVRAIRKTSRVD